MYIGTELKDLITINKIYTVHYFEYSSDFTFQREKHDFWELIYVDSGTVNICMDDVDYTLNKGDIAFHKPNEWHMVESANNTTPDVIILSFECNNEAMEFFAEKILRIDDRERAYLADILIEARHLFSCPLDDPYTQKMELNPDALIGSEQLIKLHLEGFLIHLLRRCSRPSAKATMSKIDNGDEELKHILSYMEENIYSKLTIKDICEDNMLNRMQLQNLFNKHLNTSAMDYFIGMKISCAKRLIRSGVMNFNQISEKLGYSTVHYFSKQFKQITGMTPTDYAQSIKALSEKSGDNSDN